MAWSEEEIDSFFEAAWSELEVAQDLLARRFNLPYGRWDMEQTTATITLSGEGKPDIVFDAVAIGSLANGSWMWSWANRGILEGFSSECRELKKLAKTTGLRFFDTPLWEDADEEDAWQATAIALKTLGGLAAYRCPLSNGTDLFVILRERFNA